MRKRVLGLVLVFAMMCAFLPCVASAETSGTCGENVTWVLDDDGTLTISGEGEMKNSAFRENINIKSVVIENGVTSIGGYAFYGCTGLISINIPDSVTSIGKYAFGDCSGLTSVNIPDSVTSIGNYAFSGCESLTSINIPDSVSSIGYSAFSGCSGLTSVYITDLAAWCNISFESYDSNPLFYAHNLYINDTLATDIIIPDGATFIGNYAFYGCDSLLNVAIPTSVTYVGNGAFYGTGYYNDINNWENGVLYIDNCLVSAESNIMESEIKDGCRIIASGAFHYCYSLTNITIPDSVTSIGDYAFGCCNNLTSINVNPENSYYCSVGGNLFNKEMTELIQYAIGKPEISYVIPNNVTSIGGYAFEDCSSLTSVTIPNSVTSIGDYAFHFCVNLTSITISDGVTSIGGHAFNFCESLTSITIPDSVTSIGDYAFHRCRSLTSITIGKSVTSIGSHAFWQCDSLTRVTIPNGVTSIGFCSFEYCSNLTNIAIPDSVASIGYRAFHGCDNLTDVYYSGTEAEWSAITIDSGNDRLTNAEIHYNCLGVPPEPACISVESRSGVAVITNTASEEKTVSAVSAAYDGDGRFTGSKSRRLTLSAGESREIDLSPEDKLFVWNSLGGMQNLLQY